MLTAYGWPEGHFVSVRKKKSCGNSLNKAPLPKRKAVLILIWPKYQNQLQLRGQKGTLQYCQLTGGLWDGFGSLQDLRAAEQLHSIDSSIISIWLLMPEKEVSIATTVEACKPSKYTYWRSMPQIEKLSGHSVVTSGINKSPWSESLQIPSLVHELSIQVAVALQ